MHTQATTSHSKTLSYVIRTTNTEHTQTYAISSRRENNEQRTTDNQGQGTTTHSTVQYTDVHHMVTGDSSMNVQCPNCKQWFSAHEYHVNYIYICPYCGAHYTLVQLLEYP